MDTGIATLLFHVKLFIVNIGYSCILFLWALLKLFGIEEYINFKCIQTKCVHIF